MATTINQAVQALKDPASTVKIIDKDKVGFAGVNSETFLKLLITQLQNQDPTNPTDNKDLMQQIGSMQSLSANLELQNTLKSFATSDQAAGASALIGKTITGTIPGTNGTAGETVTGQVDKVTLKDNKAYLSVNGKSVPYTSISEVKNTSLIPNLPSL